MPDDTPVKVTATESEKAQTVEKAAEVSAQTEQSETPVQEANLAAEETAAARADEIQPEKTTDAAELPQKQKRILLLRQKKLLQSQPKQ